MSPGTLSIEVDASCPLAVLEADVRRRAARGERVQIVFDLDDTLFLVRPRKQAIFRELSEVFGAHPSVAAALARLSEGHIPYDVVEALRQAGIHDEAHHAPLQNAFFDRFFDGSYTRHDAVCPGAPGYVATLHEAGARVVYLSGRPAEMIAHTRDTLADAGFPLEQRSTDVLLKGGADAPLSDVAFKQVAAVRLAAHGPCAAVFDNEPGNLNAMHPAMPEAQYFLMDTDHSPSPPPLVMAAHVVPDFRGKRERLAAMWNQTPSFAGGRFELSVAEER